MSYAETLKFLYGLQYRGIKFGLGNIRRLLRAAGNPERSFPSVHIAGTNGKGSTASFLASMLMEAGYRTGLYTSPHLERFTERIRIDGREMAEDRLVGYVRALRPVIEATRATFFEATTCVAFMYFAEENVDAAVVETGLGGRLDATNVLRPLVSIITNIALEHTEYLGNTIPAIAREKGGIIKPRVPVVTASDDPAALSAFRAIARRRSAPFFRAEDLVTIDERDREGTRVSFVARQWAVSGAQPGLAGLHQKANARLAVAAASLLMRRGLLARLTPAALGRGLAHVRRNSGLHGRLELFGGRKRFILDVAHNAAGARALAGTLLQEGGEPFVVVFGALKDKDHRQMLRELSPVACLIIAVSPRTGRALPVRRLLQTARYLGMRVRSAGSVGSGVRMALREAGRSGRILVTGSHYVVGEAMSALRKKKT